MVVSEGKCCQHLPITMLVGRALLQIIQKITSPRVETSLRISNAFRGGAFRGKDISPLLRKIVFRTFDSLIFPLRPHQSLFIVSVPGVGGCEQRRLLSTRYLHDSQTECKGESK